MPQIRAQDASAIERKTGYQVEGGEEKVHIVDVVEHFDNDAIRYPFEKNCEHQEQNAKAHAGQRPCNCREKFGAGTAGLDLSHLRHTAENEKGDLPYRNAEPPRNDAMTQLVQEDATKKGQRTN